MMAEHEKWEFQDSDEQIIIVGGKDRDYICSIQIKQCGGGAIASAMEGRRKANARCICRDHNNVDALLDAVEKAMNWSENEADKRYFKEVISQAQENPNG
ncbi:hypothetical protein LCGC14_2461660 [marine sediment metagenome]|uniref:Uncharacterized protein n=1 Tax=marine sediment metagenome TaxID=412755 RepID=A0A0F9DQ78_9ZZZZ